MATKRFQPSKFLTILAIVLVCAILAFTLWFFLNKSQKVEAPTVEDEQSEAQPVAETPDSLNQDLPAESDTEPVN